MYGLTACQASDRARSSDRDAPLGSNCPSTPRNSVDEDGNVQLDPKEIDDVCDLIKELCGIYLDSTKGYLIESRLGDWSRRITVAPIRQLAEKARSFAGSGLKREIVDAITTRETLFFRDSSPYEALQFKALPELLDERPRPHSEKTSLWSQV